jgi:hypothetical protein
LKLTLNGKDFMQWRLIYSEMQRHVNL